MCGEIIYPFHLMDLFLQPTNDPVHIMNWTQLYFIVVHRTPTKLKETNENPTVHAHFFKPHQK